MEQLQHFIYFDIVENKPCASKDLKLVSRRQILTTNNEYMGDMFENAQ